MGPKLDSTCDNKFKCFHNTIIVGPGWYNYHGFMIIAQPYTRSLYIQKSEMTKFCTGFRSE